MPIFRASTGVTLPIAESDVTGLPAHLAALNAGGPWLPSDYGYFTWSIDPAYAGTGGPLAAGVQTLVKVRLPAAATISKVALVVTTGLAGTPSNSFASLYTSDGTRRAVTADLTATWANTGYYEHSFTGSYAGAAGFYYVGLQFGAGSTPVQISRNASAIVTNGGLTGANLRFGTLGSSLTSAPTSIVPANITASTSAASASFFVALL